MADHSRCKISSVTHKNKGQRLITLTFFTAAFFYSESMQQRLNNKLSPAISISFQPE